MSKLIKYVFIIIFALVSGRLFSQTPVNIDRAIQNSVNRIYSSLPNNTKIFVYDIQSEYFQLSRYITDRLISSITNNSKKNEIGLIILERNPQNMNIMSEEIYFQYSGEVSDETAISLGRRIGAEIIIIGNVKNISNNLILHIRIIHIETAQILSGIDEYIRINNKVRVMTREEHRETRKNNTSLSLYNNNWMQNRLYLGTRMGFSPNIYTLNSNIGLTAENYISFDAGLQIGVRISNRFVLQTEIMYSSDEVTVEGDNPIILKSNSLTIPLLIKFQNMRGIFYYSFFNGIYYPISLGTMDVNLNGNIENYKYNYPPGFILGIDFGWKVGPGIIFADIRFSQDFSYTKANEADQFIRTGFNFSIGYNFPLWGIR